MADLRLTEIAERTRLSLRYWQRQAAAGVIPGARAIYEGRNKRFVVDESEFDAWWKTQLKEVPHQPLPYNGFVALLELRTRQPELLKLARLYSSWVYFAACGDRVKIGYSAFPRTRLSSLRTGNPHPVFLVGLIRGDEEYEDELHQRFSAAHTHGDWFKAVRPLVEFIEQEAGP